MSDPFLSSKDSVAWGKDRIRELERAIQTFVNDNPYAYVVEVDSDAGEDVHKVALTKQMPRSLVGLTNDAVQNLRAALDQAGFAVNPRGRYTAFPFANSAANLDDQIKGRSKELPKEIQDLMRSFKPYKGGNNLLWALNELCNTHKHAIVRPLVTRVGGLQFSPMTTIEGPLTMFGPNWDRTKNEMILARVAHGRKFDAQYQLALHITLSHVEFVDGEPAIAILDQLVRIVDGIVMVIELEAKRLGLV